MKERVGAALSLDKFAKAKISKYDKRKVIEKQRALKAKQLNKYKKLEQRLGSSEPALDYTPYDPAQDDMPQNRHAQQDNEGQQHQQQDHQQHAEDRKHKQQRHVEQQAADAEQQDHLQHGAAAVDEEHNVHKKHRKHHKPPSQLQRLADKAAADQAAKVQERQQREQALAGRQQQLQQKQKQRSHQKHDFFKKTKGGQPVMKYRVDKILAVLEKEKGVKS